MTWREQDRRHRRGEPSGGAPARRTDRIRRAGQRQARDGGAAGAEDFDDVDVEAEYDDYDETPRRSARRALRRPSVSRALGQVLGRLTTRRAALLALVVCALALSIAVPLHTYVSQRDDLHAQIRQQEVLRAQESALDKREQQLNDPAQIEAEARTRLHYVMPGETPYVVQLPNTASVPNQNSGTPQAGPNGSWYQALWNSIVGASG